MNALTGKLDAIQGHLVHGWLARSPEGTSSWVEITVGGSIVAVLRAEDPRPDLASDGLGDCAWTYPLPIRFWGVETLAVAAFDRATGRELVGSPILVSLVEPDVSSWDMLRSRPASSIARIEMTTHLDSSVVPLPLIEIRQGAPCVVPKSLTVSGLSQPPFVSAQINEGYVFTDGSVSTNRNDLIEETLPKSWAGTWRSAFRVLSTGERVLRNNHPTVVRIDEPVVHIFSFGSTWNLYHLLFDAISKLAGFQELNSRRVLVNEKWFPTSHASQFRSIVVDALAGFEVTWVDTDIVECSDLLIPAIHGVGPYAVAQAWTGLDIQRLGSMTKTRAVSRIYVSRTQASHRRVIEEEPVKAALRQLGFYVAVLEELSFHEQVDLFEFAELVVAPHGAGLANLLWSKRPGTLIEMAASDDLDRSRIFRPLTAAKGWRHVVFCCTGIERSGNGDFESLSCDTANLISLVREEILRT